MSERPPTDSARWLPDELKRRAVAALMAAMICCFGSASAADLRRTTNSPPNSGVRVSETTLLDDMECFKIETPAATYFYGRRGAGFASILDPEGHDWISYRHGHKALGEYRGLPKCGQPTKYFHCGYGFGPYQTDNPFVSRVTLQEPGHVRIESE